MTIRSKVLEVKRRLLDEFITGDHSFSSGVQEVALAAINDGPHSDKLREYMTMFADDPKQLLRLMAEDGTDTDADMNRARSYLLADGTCGTETATNFGNNTTLVLDQ
ncbi:MAG TPA: hypothetical protein VGQ39_03725 [Pyrinomonadaceae bacterium]|jgi:hypothetical protein|nr:hypothetical protein [Pyrinomonadaceae bacterium]